MSTSSSPGDILDEPSEGGISGPGLASEETSVGGDFGPSSALGGTSSGDFGPGPASKETPELHDNESEVESIEDVMVSTNSITPARTSSGVMPVVSTTRFAVCCNILCQFPGTDF